MAAAIGAVVNMRRAATVLTVAAGCLFGYHAVFGHNGITAYAAKRVEDKSLGERIAKLQEENARLKSHVEHLRTDGDAIEVAAHQRLHYTRAGEVIYAMEEPKAVGR